jgi:small subunit ribosomal protein S4
MKLLEGRLDNVMVRAGFAPTRSAARQMVSHGHIKVNDVIVTIPSYQVSVGDLITIREGSKNKAIFSKIDEELKNFKWPVWMTVDPAKREVKIVAEAVTDMSELLFDVGQVLEFYTR